MPIGIVQAQSSGDAAFYDELNEDSYSYLLEAELLELVIDDALGIQKAIDNPLPFELQLSEFLAREWEAVALGELALMTDAELGAIISSGVVSPLGAQEFHRQLSGVLGPEFAAKYSNSIHAAVDDVYELSRRAAAHPLGEIPRYGAIDDLALGVMKRDTTFWVGDTYNRQLTSRINTTMARVAGRGLGRVEGGAALRGALGSQFKRTDAYWRVVASANLNRTRNIGRLIQYHQLGIGHYELVGIDDERQTQICRSLSGTVYSIEIANNVVSQVLSAETPEQSRDAMPWVGWDDSAGMLKTSDGTLVDPGEGAEVLASHGISVPPFHGCCRTEVDVADVEYTMTETGSFPTGTTYLGDTRGMRDRIDPIDLRSGMTLLSAAPRGGMISRYGGDGFGMGTIERQFINETSLARIEALDAGVGLEFNSIMRTCGTYRRTTTIGETYFAVPTAEYDLFAANSAAYNKIAKARFKKLLKERAASIERTAKVSKLATNDIIAERASKVKLGKGGRAAAGEIAGLSAESVEAANLWIRGRGQKFSVDNLVEAWAVDGELAKMGLGGAVKTEVAINMVGTTTLRMSVTHSIGGVEAVRIGRTIAFGGANEMTVTHNLFTVSKNLQGKGLSKAVMSRSFGFYDAAGLNKTVVAAIDTGTYAWPRYGFDSPHLMPTIRKDFVSECATRGLSPEVLELAGNVKTLPELAVFEYNGMSLGKDFLLGKRSYYMEFNVDNEVQRRLFNNYVSATGN